MLTFEERQYHVSRIISNYSLVETNGRIFQIHRFSKENRYRANIFYKKLVRKSSFNYEFSRTDALKVLKARGLWSENEDKQLEQIPKALEDLKCELYRARLEPSRVQAIRKHLEALRKREKHLSNAKAIFDRFTYETLANAARIKFLIASHTYENGEPVWDMNTYLKDRNTYLLDRLVINYQKQCSLSVDQLRFISRTSPWRDLWSISEGKVVDYPISDWDIDLRTLAMFSKTYDNAFQSIEFPGDELIDDDDMFDGWMIYQKRERDKERKETKQHKFYKPGAGEIFIPAKSGGQAREINDHNDLSGKMIKKQREALIKARGTVDDTKMPDSQQKMRIMAHNKMRGNVKGQ